MLATFGPVEVRTDQAVLDTEIPGAVSFTTEGVRISADGELLESTWADVASLGITAPAFGRRADGLLLLIGTLLWPVRTGAYDVVVTRWSEPQHAFRLAPGPRSPYDYPSLYVVESLVAELDEERQLSRLGDVPWMTRFVGSRRGAVRGDRERRRRVRRRRSAGCADPRAPRRGDRRCPTCWVAR